MNRIKLLIYASIIFLATACQKTTTVTHDDFRVSGLQNNDLIVPGSRGGIATFSITSNYSWRILPCEGVTFEPSQGSAGYNMAVVVKATDANNSSETIRLGDVTFRVESTRFVGVVAYQTPQIEFKDDNHSVFIEPLASSTASFDFTAATPDFEIIADGVDCILTRQDKLNGKYTATVTAKEDNLTNEDRTIGHLSFYVDGIEQEAKVQVNQAAAIRFDKSRIKLSGHNGASNFFNVISPFEFSVHSSSAAFSTDVDGKRVTISALSANASNEEISLGDIEVSLTSVPECRATIDVRQRIERAPQTLLFYFIGTSLRSYYMTNLQCISKAIDRNILGKSRVLIYIQNSTSSATLYEYQYDELTNKAIAEPIKDYTLPARYDEQLFYSNLADMIGYAPAEHYGLVIGSHGKGWIPKSGSLLSSRGEDLREKMWTPVEGALVTRHIGDSSSTQFNTTEISQAIENLGIRFDYILFDACFMSNIEAAYDIRNTADYIIASPCEVMGQGFPYEDILKYLFTDNGRSHDLDTVCRKYVDFYESQSYANTRSACVALIHCAELEQLAKCMKTVNSAATREYKVDDIQSYEGISPSSNPTHIFFDLEDLVEQSCADSSAVSAMKEQLDRTVTSRYHTAQFYSAYNGRLNPINHYCGITTSAPATAYSSEWLRTEWYRATH